MAYSATNLRRTGHLAHLAADKAPNNHWAYTTADAAATVEASNYFNSAFRNFRKGDLISAVMALADGSGTPVHKTYVVTSETGAATVVIALQATTAG